MVGLIDIGKENTMNELERVREQIAIKLYNTVYFSGWQYLTPDTQDKYRKRADQILSLKGIRIECDVQGLPFHREENLTDHMVYKEAQQDMLKPDSEGNHWVEVSPKENKE